MAKKKQSAGKLAMLREAKKANLGEGKAAPKLVKEKRAPMPMEKSAGKGGKTARKAIDVQTHKNDKPVAGPKAPNTVPIAKLRKRKKK
jgi:hypothetical protein